MGFAIRPAAVHAAAIQHHVDAQLAPGQLLHRRLMQQANRVVSNAQRVALLPHIPSEATVAGIVLQQMGRASAFASSLIATTEISARRPDSYSARNALRPMRPKPFIAMRMVMLLLKKGRPRRADSPAPGRR